MALCSVLGIWMMLSSLPTQMPMHWNIEGQVDRFGTHTEFMMLCLLPLGLIVLFMILPFIDPKRANYKKHLKAYTVTKFVTVLFFIGLNWLIVLNVKGIIQGIDNLIID